MMWLRRRRPRKKGKPLAMHSRMSNKLLNMYKYIAHSPRYCLSIFFSFFLFVSFFAFLIGLICFALSISVLSLFQGNNVCCIRAHMMRELEYCFSHRTSKKHLFCGTQNAMVINCFGFRF